MSLDNPAIAYKTIRDAIITLLRNNKSTLNEGLTSGKTFTKDEQIKAGNPFTTPVAANEYPVILVKIISKEEDFHGLGGGGRKLATITYRIFAMVRIFQKSQDDDDEVMKLTENIEEVFRDNIDINGNVLYSNPSAVDFFAGAEGSTYVSVASIDLQCNVEVS